MLVSASDAGMTLRSHKKKKAPKMRYIYIIIAIVVFLYLFAAVFASIRNNISTVTAVNGSVVESFATSGYVLREQQVISAPSDGFFECVVSEGERVKKGQTVAYMFEAQPDPALMEKIRKTVKSIAAQSGDNTGDAYFDGSNASQTTVAERIRNMSDKRSERNLKNVREAKNGINNTLGRKSESGENNAKTTEQLTEELNALKREAGGGTEIVADAGGVFSSRIDNLEDKLSLDAIDNISPFYINEIDKSKSESSDIVAAGRPLCKIVNNYKWAYAAVVDEKKLGEIREGAEVELLFYDLTSVSVSGTIAHISDAEGGKKAVVVSTNKYVDGIYSSSCVNAEIITVKADGIKLPSECLHVCDGVTGVYVVRLNTAKFVPVNVKYKNEQDTVVSAAEPESGGTKLQIYDEVIVSGKNISEGKVIR